MTHAIGLMPRHAAAAPTSSTSAADTAATEFPAGPVQLERSGLKAGLRIPGGIAALAGAALLGVSLLSRKPAGAIESRLLTAPLAVGGTLVGVGAASVLGAELVQPRTRLALATNIPTAAKASEVARTFDRQTEVVKDVNGRYAVLDLGPKQMGGGSYIPPRDNHYYGDGHRHDHHWYGDGHGHYHPPDYVDPYYPTEPYYPPTSPGDDYNDYPSGGSGGSTSRGDDGGSYNPPSYDPPSYDPPSYDPPSYDPPSYGGNSSSNGNPSEDDF